MESVDYSTYFNPNQQSYQWYGADNNGYSRNGSNEGGRPVPVSGHTSWASDQPNSKLQETSVDVPYQSMEETFDVNPFLSNSFDYTFDASLGNNGSVASNPTGSNSSSPPAQQLSTFPNASVDSGIALDMDNDLVDMSQGRRGSSEEKENLTPAQSRRKAQNRAAQRAFRERKERHVRDLETKLNLLTTTTSSLQSDNERLKLLLQRAQTENEVLKATVSSSPTRHHPPGFVDDPSLLPASQSTRSTVSEDEPSFDGVRLANGLLSSETSSSGWPSSRNDCHLLSASATWDLLQSHPLYLSGAVDIGEVCERLKKMAKCDGTGPMFEEEEVRKVIEEVGRSGGDGLI